MRALAEALMVEHYDPAYAKSRAAVSGCTATQVRTETLDAEGLARAAVGIEAALAGL